LAARIAVLIFDHISSMGEKSGEYGASHSTQDAASIFTLSGAAARKFRYEAPTRNISVNIGVATPMPYFPFSGWKDSFFCVLH
jgi:malonate-semialdehyde dehydrogenase (acetylating)/methylmalonate-semialdehyde dehydrogenase